jgi:hypothetical protein
VFLFGFILHYLYPEFSRGSSEKSFEIGKNVAMATDLSGIRQFTTTQSHPDKGRRTLDDWTSLPIQQRLTRCNRAPFKTGWKTVSEEAALRYPMAARQK